VIAASQHAPAPASYTVKWGDTLSQIALDFYGNPRSYPEIQQANSEIVNPDLIYAGDTLKIPDAASVPPQQYVPRHGTAHKPRHAKPSIKPMEIRHSAVKHTAVRHQAPHFSAPASGNMVQIARYFVNHGATKTAAAGVAACIWGESGGNPESVGSGGFGLIGWTGNNIGLPRGYFGPTGDVRYDMAVQLAGVVGYINANGGWGPINSAGSAVGAAMGFSSKYERPAILYADIHYGGAGDPVAICNAI